MPRLIIFANGLVPDLESARRILQPGDVFYAADGGSRHAAALGIVPSVIIGDLDSLEAGVRSSYGSRSVQFLQYPRDKNETDLELALHHAVQEGYREIVIMGGLGGRIDQTLGNLSLLACPGFAALTIRMDDGMEEAIFTRKRCAIIGQPGEVVSLIPWGSKVNGISTDGLRWPLHDETLFPDQTRGLSNEMNRKSASVVVKSGLLLVIHRRQRKTMEVNP